MPKDLRDEVEKKLLAALEQTKASKEDRENAKKILVDALESDAVVRVLDTFVGNG